MVSKGDLEKRRDLGDILTESMSKKGISTQELIHHAKRDPLMDYGLTVIDSVSFNRYRNMVNDGNTLNHIRKLLSIMHVLDLDLETTIKEMDRRVSESQG